MSVRISFYLAISQGVKFLGELTMFYATKKTTTAKATKTTKVLKKATTKKKATKKAKRA